MLAFFCKKSAFFDKNSTFTQAIVWELCSRFFSSIFSFCKIKGYYYWKCKFYRLCIQNLSSGLLQIGHKSEKCHGRHNFLTWHHRQFFWRCFVSLLKFSYWSKFHINSTTGSEVMTIFLWKGLPEILKLEIPHLSFARHLEKYNFLKISDANSIFADVKSIIQLSHWHFFLTWNNLS